MARAKEAKPKRRGRPRLPPTEGKRYPLNMRTTKKVRDEVVAAAKESGRSLAHEVESLVEQALSEKEDLGGPHVYDMFRLLGAVARLIEARTGKRSSDDWETWYALQKAWQKLIPALGPKPSKKLRRLQKAITDAKREQPSRPGSLPSPPLMPREQTGILADLFRPVSEEQQQALAKKWADYERQMDEYRRQLADREAHLRMVGKRLEGLRDYLEPIIDLADEAALELLPEPPQKKA